VQKQYNSGENRRNFVYFRNTLITHRKWSSHQCKAGILFPNTHAYSL